MSKRIKRCQVCGDEASGFNFTCLTCGSCRLFFHRNFTKYKELTCRRESNCVIEANNRKSCSKCRLDKCLAIGMKKKPPKKSTSSSSISSDDSTSDIICPSESITTNCTEMRRTLETIENILELSVRNQSTLAQISQNYLQGKPFFVTWRNENIANATTAATALDLNRHELRHITSLENAFSIFANENDATVITVSNDVVSSFNMPAIYATRVVKFCKQFPDFKSLNPEIQLTLLKLFYTEMMTIRIGFNYDMEKRGYPLIQDETGSSVLFVKSESLEVMQRKDLVMQNRQVLYNLKIELENDTTMRNVATAMLLFKPRDCIPCNEAMRYKYFQYCNLLRRYMEHKYRNTEVAGDKFTRVVNLTNELEIVRRNYAILLQEFNGDQIVQVLAEIFNISQ